MTFYNTDTKSLHTLDEIKQAHPEVSWPENPSVETLEDFNYVPVVEDVPHAEPWQVVTFKRVRQAQGVRYTEYSVTDRPLAELKADKLAELASYRYRVEQGGITVDGFAIATDDRTQSKLSGAALAAQLDPSFTTPWKGKEGWLELAAAQIVPLALAVSRHVQACFVREKELVDEIDGLSTAAEVGGFDIAGAWHG